MTFKVSMKAQDPFGLGYRLYWKVIFGYVFENIMAFSPLLLKIRNGNWLLLMTGQCFKNNESHSSFSLEIGRSTCWLGRFFLNSIFTIFSQESHRAYQVKVRTLELRSSFCWNLSVLCTQCPLSTSVHIDKMGGYKKIQGNPGWLFSVALHISVVGSYKTGTLDLEKASSSASSWTSTVESKIEQRTRNWLLHNQRLEGIIRFLGKFSWSFRLMHLGCRRQLKIVNIGQKGLLKR